MRSDGNGASPRAIRVLAAFGMAGPVLYVAAVLLGAALWPGYSHFAETISTLTSQGAPNQAILVPLFAIYNVTLLSLAVGLQSDLRKSRPGGLGPALLAAAAGAGLLLFFFPQGPWSAPLSGMGVEHTIVAGLDALFFLLAMGFLWRRLRADPRWETYGTFTFGMLVVGSVLGGFGAMSVSAPYAGLAERLSIGCFLLWVEVLAMGLFIRVSHEARGSPTVRTHLTGA